MTLAWRLALQRLGLSLAAFSALLFIPLLEDAYVLPQRLALGLAAAMLALAAPLRLPLGRLGWLLLAFFSWRLLAASLAQAALPLPVWAAEQGVLVALLLFGGAALRDDARSRRFAAALVAAGALGAFLALLPALGWDPWADGAVDLGFAGRAHGTLGNPDFLGGWLALILPLALLAGLQGKRWAWPALALMLAALAHTQARASWLAGAVGLGAVLALHRPTWLGLRGLGLAALLLGLAFTQRGDLPPRLAEALDLRSDAWQSRAFMAGVALDLALEHPIVGVGAGGFGDAYLHRQGQRLSAGERQPYRYTLDAHNDWAQIAAESGWLGLLLWVAAFGLALRIAWRRRAAALLGGLLAFGVQACFHFPWAIWPSAGLLMLGLGYLAALDAGDQAPASPPWIGWVAAALLLATTALGLRQLASSALLNHGVAAQLQAATAPLASGLFAKSAALRPEDLRPWQRLAGAHLAAGRLDPAIAAAQSALQAGPQQPETWALLGLALGQQGSLDAAEQACGQAVGLNPRSAEAWGNWSKVAWLRGDSPTAEARLRQGLESAGESPLGLFNLGAILYHGGRCKEAIPKLQRVLALQPDHREARRLLQECGRAR